MATLDLVSAFSLAECQRLLALALRHSSEIYGSINGTTLRARKQISYRNSFQTHLSANLLDENASTRIHCRFLLNPLTIVLLAVWFGFVLLAGGGRIIAGLGELASSSPEAVADLAGSLIPGILLFFGGLLVLTGRFLARGERLALTDFIRETLKASPCP